mmetsp:Transcript_38515/g.48619  ORF Transcript_38515/g.48619 Transcript_38515/m.48619 type:complete len:477 (+) Transcript_38515:123-1553(+)
MSGFQVCCKILFPGGDVQGEKYRVSELQSECIVTQVIDREPFDLKIEKEQKILVNIGVDLEGISVGEETLSSDTTTDEIDIFTETGGEDHQNLSVNTNSNASTWKIGSWIQSKFRKPTLIKNFHILQVIGMGSWGKVVLASKKDVSKSYKNLFEARNEPVKKLFAIKIMNKNDLIRTNLCGHALSERNVLHSIAGHPFLIELQYAFQDDSKLYLAMEYCPGGDIFYKLNVGGVFTENQVSFYSAELSLALQHLHDKEIMYRDMKPENILIDYNGHIKLTDFGLSKMGITSAFSGSNSMCGTQNYMAPEMISRTGHGYAVDWWGLGILIYEMLTGSPPWYDSNITTEQLFNSILKAPLHTPAYFSEDVVNMLQCLLERDPTQRLGSTGIEPIQQHSFFSNIDWVLLFELKMKPPDIPGNTISETGLNFDERYSSVSVHSKDGVEGDSQEDCSSQSPTAQSMRDVFKDFDYENPNLLQ